MLYLFVGKNDFLREESVRQLKALMYKLPLGEHNIDELGPGTTVADVIAASSVTPFLSEKRMVIARGVLAGASKGRTRARARTRATATAAPGAPADELAAWAPNLPDTTHLVIVEDDPKTVAGLDSVQPPPVRRDFAVLRDDALPGWITQRASKSYKARINPRAAADLAQLAGSDLRTLDAEIAKLSTYVAPGQEIGVDDVRTLVSSVGPNIFAFQDAIAERRPAAALSAARAMMDRGTEPMELFQQIVALARRLLVVKELARTHRLSQDATSFGLSSSPYALQKLQRQAANLSNSDLDRAYQSLHETDMAIKTGKVEPAMAVELAITVLVGLSSQEGTR